MQTTYLDFEHPLEALDKQVSALGQSDNRSEQQQTALAALEDQLRQCEAEVFSALSPWQRVQLSRHPDRPYTLDYIEALCSEFVELHGDRVFGDDPAIVGGLARFRGTPVVVVGHQRGKTVTEKVHRNFGMPRPEGYRKALRLFHLAEQFQRPVLSFVDTQGAYPGVGAEERGQAEAIARNIQEMAGLKTPIIVTVIGEGGSGGALALGVGDRILMQENACYSVITPEGCAAILFGERTPERSAWAAEALKVTAPHLLDLGVIDEMIAEPSGGAHRHTQVAISDVGAAIDRHLQAVSALSVAELMDQRYTKFRRMGEVGIVDTAEESATGVNESHVTR